MVTFAERARRLIGSFGRGRIHVRQGNRARDAGDFATAAASYARALRHLPGNARIQIQAGHMFKESGDLVAAERHYLQALALLPDDHDAHLQLAHLYKDNGRPHLAYAHFLRLAELAPDESQHELEALRRRLNIGEGAGETLPAPISAEQMMASGLIDGEWYSRTYPDIGPVDPYRHFIDHGRFELRHPGPGFDPHWYLKTYPDVVRSGLDPFAHYLTSGREAGLKPVGPMAYQRWIADHDTLDGSDRRAIAAHIAEADLSAPIVLLAVDARTEIHLADAIRGLRDQQLKLRCVHICIAADCSPDALRTARALVGSDDRFRIVDAARPLKDAIDGDSVVLIDAAIELRDHALYMLAEAALRGAALVYADHDRIDADRVRHDPMFKPDASPELLRQVDYIGACGLLSAGQVTGACVADLVAGRQTVADLLRTAGLAADRAAIAHVPFLLYHDHVERAAPPSPAGPRLAEADLPTVTIIIPTRDRLDLIRPCIESLHRETDYPLDRIEIVVVDNGSVEDDTLDWLAAKAAAGDLRTIHAPIPFNYPILNNMAAETSTADVLVLLNNDTEVQDPDWLRGLVAYAMQADVGAVGPKLLYDDGTIQHAGVVLGVGGVAAHAHCGIAHDAPGALGFAQRTREVAAVTGACLAIRRTVFEEIGGLDPGLPVAFNDVLLCLAAIDHGYRNLYVHDVWLRHYESKTRGRDDTVAKVKIFNREARFAREKYPDLFRCDPYYSPNLSFSLPDIYQPAFPPRATRPWQAYRSDHRPRLLLLSAALDTATEIGTTVDLQARYLADRGYEVVIGTPYSVLSKHEATGPYQMIETAQDAAAFAVSTACDAIVAHTPGFGEVSRWLGTRPPVLLHYHGERAEEASGVAGQVFQKEGRLLALPFVSHVIAASHEAAAELVVADVTILPPGADRLGVWSHRSLELRDTVRRARNWIDKVVILVTTPNGAVDAETLAGLRALTPQFDPRRISWVLLTDRGDDASPLPEGMIAVAPQDVRAREALMVGADVLWMLGRSGPTVDTIEAVALGLTVVETPDKGTVHNARRIMRALAGRIDAALVPDAWSRGAGDLPGWSEVLDRFEAVLADMQGRPRALSAGMGTVLSTEMLVAESGLFDLDIYHALNADLKDLDGHRHFIEYGIHEGRPFSKLFDTAWYLAQYPEVRGAPGGPLMDYLLHPTGSRDPNPFFSNAAYLDAIGDRDTGGLAPFVHYLKYGAADGLPVGDAFDADHYRATYHDVRDLKQPPLVHFLTIGLAEGRLATSHAPSPVDLFDDDAVLQVTDRSSGQSLPVPVDVAEIASTRSAARFLIALLRAKPDLRHRFPQALSGGPDGAFAVWLAAEGAAELGLTEAASGHVADAFRTDPGARIRQLLLIRPDVAQHHPLAMTPAGAGDLLADVTAEGRLGGERISLTSLWWFLLSVAERPAQGLVDTFLFTPIWQRLFPDGVTIFGRRALADWLVTVFGITGDWTDPSRWPETLTPAEQIRIAYAARSQWQAAHPAPFADADAARALLAWLDTPAAGLDGEATAWLARQDRAALATALATPGFNMLGHFCYASGLRTSTEALVDGFRRVGGDVSTRDVWVQERGDEDRHVAYPGLEVHDITIIHTQPEPLFDVAYERAGLAPRTPRTYRIGYWYWELETIPEHWQAQADQVDEIWAATRFVGDALKDRFDLPVHVIMPGLEHPVFERRSRAYFGLPEGTLLFLFTFHMASIMERKNPLGLIEAFITAFGKDDTVGLVLKTSFGHMYPEQLAELHAAGAGYNVIILDDVYRQGDVLALMDACDAYVSLHRSEGYGLTMAEAMLLGKPVIATAYSGNLDFMSDETSLLVRHELVTLDRDYPPYKAGTRWAHASLEHAAECMRKVRDNPEWARALGAKAKADLETRMSLEASGRKVAARIREIGTAKA